MDQDRVSIGGPERPGDCGAATAADGARADEDHEARGRGRSVTVRQSEERYRALIHTATDAIVFFTGIIAG
jgi:hypothetical protein